MLIIYILANTYIAYKLHSKTYAISALIVGIIGFIAGFDFGNPYYDIMPGRLNEIIRAIFMTLAVISILGFMSLIIAPPKIALILTLAGSIYCVCEAYYVRRTEITIYTDKLDRNIRIAFLTDIHLGGLYSPVHFARAMKIVRDASPDIVLLGGDTIDGDPEYMTRELAELGRYETYAVNGNHEHYHFLDYDVEGAVWNAGIRLLIDERIEAHGIVIIGLDDIPYGWIKPYLKPEDRDKFVLVLKHRPGKPLDAQDNFDLQLSGHTHGGQFWPIGYFKNLALNSKQGLHGKIFVSNGVGFNGAMMRLFTTPEVVIIDVISSSDTNRQS